MARTAGLTNAEVNKAVGQSAEALSAKIKGLIGETGYAQLERSEKALGLRPYVEPIVIDLRAVGVPPSADQSTRLAASLFDHVLANMQSSFRGLHSLTNTKDADPQTGLTPQAQAVIDRYVEFLTPARTMQRADVITRTTSKTSA